MIKDNYSIHSIESASNYFSIVMLWSIFAAFKLKSNKIYYLTHKGLKIIFKEGEKQELFKNTSSSFLFGMYLIFMSCKRNLGWKVNNFEKNHVCP